MKSSLYQKTVLLVSFAFLFGIGVSYVVFEKPFKIQQNNGVILNNTDTSYVIQAPKNVRVDFDMLPEIWDLLREKYVEPEKLSLQKLGQYAIKGFVAGVGDPYTVYMTKEESQEFQENLNGQLEGIGAELEVRNGKLTVVTALKNSPALAAGIKSGDIIEKVNGEAAEDMTLHEAVRKIRGKSGTKVTLSILRETEDKPLEFVITRSPIDIESVTFQEEVAKDIALISINQFSDSTKAELSEAIQKLLLKKPKGLVLDLRYNGGGYLDISLDILSEFLSGKVVAVKIKKKNPVENEVLYTNEQARIKDISLVVLVNRGSASASEIVAGALQDYKRAVIMGERTFGKGSVQEIESLKDGSTLRLTIAKWLTPLDRDIDEVGISPDIEVEFPDDTPEGKDPQLEEAIRYLQGQSQGQTKLR